MSQTYDTFWQQRYARHLQQMIEAQAEMICAGQMNPEEYKSATGIIRGLSLAVDAIEQVNSEIRKAEQGSK